MKYLGNNSKRLGKKIQKIINVSLNQLTKERQNVHEIQHFILVKKIEMLKFISDQLHHKGDLEATHKFDKLMKNCVIAFEDSLGKLGGENKIQKLIAGVDKLLETDTEIKKIGETVHRH